MVGVVKGEVIIYRPLCGGCAVRGADMRAKARGGSRRGDVPYGGRYARRARGNGLYGDLAGGERRGVWQGGDMRAIAQSLRSHAEKACKGTIMTKYFLKKMQKIFIFLQNVRFV